MTTDPLAPTEPVPGAQPLPLPPARRGGWPPHRRRRWLVSGAVYGATLAVVAWVALSADWEKITGALLDWDIARDMFPEVVTVGVKNTLILTAFGFVGGLVLGLALAVMRLSTFAVYRAVAVVVINTFRSVPALISLLLIGQGLQIAGLVRWPDDLPLIGDNLGGAVALAIVSAAYIAENIRAGIEAVPVGQAEAARSLGMSSTRAMGSIVLPQAFRIIIPPLTNELVLLIKDTSLIGIALGVTQGQEDLAKLGRDATNDTFNLTPLVVVALMYIVITLPFIRLTGYLESRARRAKR